MFSRQHNFIFIHIPKTGGSSFSTILLKHSDDKKVILPHKEDGKERFGVKGQWTTRKHQTLQEYYDLMPREIFEKQKIAIILRHPVDRLISLYFTPYRTIKKAKKNWLNSSFDWLGIKIHFLDWEFKDFEFDLSKFEKLIHRRKSQSDNLELNGQIRQPDVLIDFSDFKQSALEAFKKLGLPEKSIPHRNKTLTKQAKTMLVQRPDVIDIIMSSHHAIDFENFSYMGWKV